MSKEKQAQQDTQSKTRVNKPVQEEMRGEETAVSSPIPSLQRAYADPRTLTSADAQALQRTIGNQALGRLMIQRKMTLGPVGDKYEQEADTVAKQVVNKLHASPTQSPPAQTAQRQEEEELQMSPLVQRQEEEELQAKGDPMLAGGELSGDVESSVQSAKSGGQQLNNTIRQPMEQAFGADFSSIKVHTGRTADSLNRSLSARAFTSGQDVFFRSGEYNPSSSAGQELLAHELTHTIQQGASPKTQAQRFPDNASGLITAEIQRSSMMIQRLFGSKKSEDDDAFYEGDDDDIQWVDNPAYVEKNQWVQNPMQQQGAAAPPAQGWQGKAGKITSTAEEAGKPTAAIGTSGIVAAAASSAGGEFAAPSGVGALGVLQMGDAIMGLNNARGMNAEADQFNDKGMKNLAGRKAKDQSAGLAMATVGTAKGGAGIASAAQAGTSAAGMAGGVLGIVGGSAMVIQGSWRGGKAVMKLCRLTWGRGKEMLSSAGAKWKAVIMNAEKFKLAINALKIAAGALGIAAGALLIVSNPVGWAVGLAAAIAGGVYAAGKIAGKIKNTRDKNASKKKLAGQGASSEAASSSEMVIEDDWDMAEYRTKRDMARPRGANISSEGAEYAPPEKDDSTKRKEAIEMANAVARDASKNARVAGEMRAALSLGNKDAVASALNTIAQNPQANLAELLVAPADQELHDAVQLLSAINVDPDEALSDSGQDLIEKKLSKAEAM